MNRILPVVMLLLLYVRSSAAQSVGGYGNVRTNDAVGSRDGSSLQEWTEPFQRIFVRIPTVACGTQGVAATVLVPREARYEAGAPVVVSVAGVLHGGSARGRTEYVGNGFVEIHFAFPGGGFAEERSGGTPDFMGIQSLRALADVVRFASGQIPALDGRFLYELVPSGPVLTNIVGLAGMGHGGNVCIATMARHGKEFPDLAWYASLESPAGQTAATGELGTRLTGPLPVYNPAEGTVDFSRLAWSPDLDLWSLSRESTNTVGRHHRNGNALRGGFYFDLNADGRFSTNADFAVHCLVGNDGRGTKAWYSMRVLTEARRRNVMPDPVPAHLPDFKEAEEFWALRDGVRGISGAVANCTNLAVIIYANSEDHAQADPAHTHILEQVQAFQKAGARFVRVNPDQAYLMHVSWRARRYEDPEALPDNPAGKTWTRASLNAGLEPVDMQGSACMQAAACELADRVLAEDWTPDLAEPLFPNAPRAPYPWFSGSGRSGQPGTGTPVRGPAQNDDGAR